MCQASQHQSIPLPGTDTETGQPYHWLLEKGLDQNLLQPSWTVSRFSQQTNFAGLNIKEHHS